MWFSASGDLALDASRDFRDIGALKYDPVRIHNLRKLKIPRSGNIADIEGESLLSRISLMRINTDDCCAAPSSCSEIGSFKG